MDVQSLIFWHDFVFVTDNILSLIPSIIVAAASNIFLSLAFLIPFLQKYCAMDFIYEVEEERRLGTYIADADTNSKLLDIKSSEQQLITYNQLKHNHTPLSQQENYAKSFCMYNKKCYRNISYCAQSQTFYRNT